MKQRALNLLIALDQFLYVVFTLGVGMPDETMSAAAYRGELDGRILAKFFRPVIDTLFWLQPEHCRKAYESELKRSQLPATYQQETSA